MAQLLDLLDPFGVRKLPAFNDLNSCIYDVLVLSSSGVVAYVSAGRRTYLAMNILTLLMAIVIIVFLFLYSTFKPKRVNVTSPVETQDTIGAVVYRRNSDQVLLLEDMEDNEHEGQGVCSNESVAETQVSDLSTLIEEDATLL